MHMEFYVGEEIVTLHPNGAQQEMVVIDAAEFPKHKKLYLQRENGHCDWFRVNGVANGKYIVEKVK